MVEDDTQQVTLSDVERRMINMSALKAASRVHEGSNDVDATITSAERFVDWILKYKPSYAQVEADVDEPATEKQKRYLRDLGIAFSEGITKKEASRLIDEKLREKTE